MQSLINKIRPKSIKEIVGQKHLIGENKILTKIVENNSMFSFILFGPPGTGKTTIASALANELDYKFKVLNAVNCTKKDLTDVIEESKRFKKVVLLLDEFHRLTKPMQDILLPEIEFDSIFVIGCTTQNPYHSVAPAIRSRMKIFELLPLSNNEVLEYLKKLIDNKEIFSNNVIFEEDTLKIIANGSSGDLRYAINTLEIINNNFENETITPEIFLKLSIGDFKNYDRDADYFYNTISALQKSIRGSDVNASLYYLALLIDSGDLETICRRLTVIAYEDIGLANPNIGPFVHAAIESAKMLGFPEARIPLSNVVIQLALSLKSNSAISAIDEAINEVNKNPNFEIPKHLRDNHYKGAENLGSGIGYKYPHSYPNNYVKQQYLPDKIKNKIFYKANTNNKNEKSLKLYEEFLKSLK
ncbi:replication-associated recombination protein A [Gemelliphila palaticanis]|uniref:Replication-associated recombination protein A n=1 Tax=Gemelliphila palaticanis TaxID=81950 RepID=A0ABX2SX72_9BACL|nr:replication-associated recombination protein A [Gemella palaticanis]MBF0714875.1 replication-associated recombination protein A [Gemella palaticanis]NYS46805.1 replication-associated recombination protein A [Gemella palaticanis]